MLGWPIWLTARASCWKRSTASALAHSSSLMTLMAARLPMSGWMAANTVPIPPSPSLPSMRYSPTTVPGASSFDGSGGKLAAASAAPDAPAGIDPGAGVITTTGPDATTSAAPAGCAPVLPVAIVCA
jgi:hypothetical protein